MPADWKAETIAKYNLYPNNPWRGHLFCPVHLAESVNRQLNREWKDEGDNLSVAMSRTGRRPAEILAASGTLTHALMDGLERTVEAHPGFLAFIVPSHPELSLELLRVLGRASHPLIGRKVSFDDCADSLGISRIPSDYMLGLAAQRSELLLQSVLIPGPNTPEGQLVAAVAIPWFSIVEILERDPEAAFQIPSRKWEEIIAGAYRRAGFEEVILTPRSGDYGRDIIAVKRGLGMVRIIDQVKAYKPGHLVTADDVRALFGVVQADGASKGFLTTTSDFAPKLYTDPLMSQFIPSRIELVNGENLLKRLKDLRK